MYQIRFPKQGIWGTACGEREIEIPGILNAEISKTQNTKSHNLQNM
jgi:hypothetical protein